jgi:hypothetical protein
MLADIIAYTLDLGTDRKEQLLAETNVDRRVALLFEYLSSADEEPERSTFPPPFSEN